jgi:hypothetical protein
MKQIKPILFLLVFVSAFVGCRKDLLEAYPDFEGNWNSENYTDQAGNLIDVNQPDLKSYFTETINGERMKQMGFAKIRKDILKIGEKEFTVSRYPSLDNEGNYSFDTNAGKYIGVYAVVNPNTVVNGTAVTFGWTNSTASTQLIDAKYIDYRKVSATDWITISVPRYAGNYTITGLAPATQYEWRIKSMRGIHSSAYSAIQIFTTQ